MSPAKILEGAHREPERLAIAKAWLNENLRVCPKTCRELIDLLLPEAKAAGDASGEAWLCYFLGWLHIDADDFAEGSRLVDSAKAAFEDLGDRVGVTRSLNALGVADLTLGVYDLALDYLRESASEAERAGRPDLAAAPSWNMAECLCRLEEPGEALQVIEHCRKELTIAPFNLAATHHSAGLIYRSLGRLEEAERELLDAVRTAGDALHNAVEAKQVLAEVYLDSGRLEAAEALVISGMDDCAKAGERMIGAAFRLSRARLLMLRNQNADAISDIEAVIAMARELSTRKIETDAEKLLFVAWQACGDHEKALAAFIRHATLKDAMKSEQTSRRILGLHDDRARREARHFESLYKHIAAVSEIGQRITANLNLDDTIETLYGLINTLMDAPTLLIALVDEEHASLDYRLVMIQGERKESFSCALDDETMGCWCVRNRQDILIGNLENEYHQYVPTVGMIVPNGRTEKSLVFVPLRIGEKVIGMLSVQSHLLNAYDKPRVETIRTIGAYIAIAVENAKLFKRAVDSERSLRLEHTALLKAQAELKHLHGIIPICAACKKIRGDGGSWHQLESYIRDHSEAEFTHGLCPDCSKKLYGDL